ncbi:hypothetical protein [Fundidesulfovibrio putealis]|uniref:hypothetical protein n=1 Tax=Fundidesulfovibrio putealis TaxID=270496 RepID=UPI00041B82DA|nr:hypothetical protein [Fundidesulfovibrio putealis]
MSINELIEGYMLNLKYDDTDDKTPIKLYLEDHREEIEELYEASLSFYDPEYYYMLKQREENPLSAYAEEIAEFTGYGIEWAKNLIGRAVMVEEMYINSVELLPQRA